MSCFSSCVERRLSRISSTARATEPEGSKFGAETVGRLLQDPTAKGVHRTNYTKRTDDDKSWELKPESDWVYIQVEPLISEQLWNDCNQHLGSSDQRNGKPAKRAVHIFAGLAFCRCGNKMYVPANSPKYICKICRTKIPAEDLEAIFVEQLRSFLISPTQVDAYLGRAQDTLTEKESLLENRKKEAEKIRQDAERTHRLYLDKEISAAAFGKFFRPIEERQKRLEDELPRLQGRVGVQGDLSGDGERATGARTAVVMGKVVEGAKARLARQNVRRGRK
jgi:site-specific DNA recombinase